MTTRRTFPIAVSGKKCRECKEPRLQIIDATDDTIEVECKSCGEIYAVETDGLGDGGIHYWPMAITIKRENRFIENKQLDAENAVVPGDRIVLDLMENDPEPIPVGTKGIVRHVNRQHNLLQVEVQWENGRQLMLTCPPDLFRILSGG